MFFTDSIPRYPSVDELHDGMYTMTWGGIKIQGNKDKEGNAQMKGKANGDKDKTTNANAP